MQTSPSRPNEENIRAIAYGFWLEEGRPDGRAEAHWLKAYELATVEPKTAAAPKKNSAAVKKLARRKAS